MSLEFHANTNSLSIIQYIFTRLSDLSEESGISKNWILRFAPIDISNFVTKQELSNKNLKIFQLRQLR